MLVSSPIYLLKYEGPIEELNDIFISKPLSNCFYQLKLLSD